MSGKTIGELSQKCDEVTLEWKILNIFSCTTPGQFFYSPKFSILNSQWYLQIFPCGQTGESSMDWIALYLWRSMNDDESAKDASFDFGLKTADGSYEGRNENLAWVFNAHLFCYGVTRFLKRSELLDRKSELAPLDILTVVCILRVTDTFDNRSISSVNTLSANLKKGFLSEKDSDVILKVKGKEFPAHKVILATQSSVFAAMLKTDMKEGNTGVVDIEDCDPVAFRDVLLYLYSGKFGNESGVPFEVYKIADKYDVPRLKSACVISIMSGLSVDNVCEAVILGHIFDDDSLKKRTQGFFDDHVGKILLTDAWKSLLRSHPDAANNLFKTLVKNKNI